MRPCEHGAGCHDGTEPSGGTAPEGWLAWLLIEHDGPWPADPLDARFDVGEGPVAAKAEALGIRVQLIRRPGRRLPDERAVFTCWSGRDRPWLRRGTVASLATLDLMSLATGTAPLFGSPATEPQFLVCTHGHRDVCCARYGGPLARDLARRYPGQVWETTHVGGHRHAANLVILPAGHYYGPVDTKAAADAITACQQGTIVSARYRGRVTSKGGLPG